MQKKNKNAGFRIEGDFVEQERQNLIKKNGYRKLPKTKACGFHRIEIDHIGIKIGTETLIHDVNLNIYCGKLTAIIGKNGAGKSTLIKAILGELPHEGTISFRDMKNNTIGKLKIGYVPQQLNVEKNAPISVYDLVAGYTSHIPVFLRKSKKLYQQIKERLQMFEGENLIDKQLGALSGGELQRVLLTIACTPVPNLLILDEPVSGIDKNGRELFYRILNDLKNSYDLSIILVSHDFDLTAKYADHVVLMNKTVQKEGSWQEVADSKEFKDVFYGIV